jgi:monoterpene epsilon-lactone hydrolase
METRPEQQLLNKPSKRVEEVSNWWRKCKAASASHSSLSEMRDFNEAWGTLTAGPGGVDYIETDAGGVPAMWAIPKRCKEDRVVLYLQGGGFTSGSMYAP